MPNFYSSAQQRYADLGVGTGSVLAQMIRILLSLQRWQGNDVGGFEHPSAPRTGGIQARGNYPGKARTPSELRADLEVALSLIFRAGVGSTCMLVTQSWMERRIETRRLPDRRFCALGQSVDLPG